MYIKIKEKTVIVLGERFNQMDCGQRPVSQIIFPQGWVTREFISEVPTPPENYGARFMQ